jgi:hypothetical protein
MARRTMDSRYHPMAAALLPARRSQDRSLAMSVRHLPIPLLIGGLAPRHLAHHPVVFPHRH